MLTSTEKKTLVITINHENVINVYHSNDLEDEGRNSLNSPCNMVLILLLIIIPYLLRRCWPSGGCWPVWLTPA